MDLNKCRYWILHINSLSDTKYIKNQTAFKNKKNKSSWKNPVGIYLLKANNKNTRTRCENMFKVNNKDTRTTPGIVLLSLLLTLNVSIVNFEHENAEWIKRFQIRAASLI